MLRYVAAYVVVCLCVVPAGATTPSFQWLDNPPWPRHPTIDTYAFGLSGNGEFVVGVSGARAFRGSAASGWEDIGDLAGGPVFAGA